jgi:hypothetical protein
MSIGGLASLVQWFVCVWVGVLVVRMVCWCSGGLFWEDVHRFGECLSVLAPPEGGTYVEVGPIVEPCRRC